MLGHMKGNRNEFRGAAFVNWVYLSAVDAVGNNRYEEVSIGLTPLPQ